MASLAYKHYVLAILAVILLFNGIDRIGLGITLQDIKTDLHLSDTQLGFLSGIAFALFYAVMGVPIARWADRGNRVLITTLTVLVWSVAVALCGLATTFQQLLLIRVVVAIGEAGCIPCAFSLIADYFDRAERARAVSLYGLGGTFSTVVGSVLAGWWNELYGWRVTFVLLGTPGVVLAAVAWFTLHEPRLAQARRSYMQVPAFKPTTERAPAPSMREVCQTLWRNRTFLNLLMCLSVLIFFNFGIAQWQATFLKRSLGLSTGQIGTWLAVVFGAGGLLGAYLAGEWAARRAARNESLQLQAVALMILCCGFLSVLIYLWPNRYLTFALIGFVALGLTAINGPLFGTMQTLIPERMRAVAFALAYLVANFLGMGLGPLAVGAMSDALRPWAGEESLRFALLVLSPGYTWAAWHAWRGGRTAARDLAQIKDNPDASGNEARGTNAAAQICSY